MKYWDRAWNPVYGCTECSEGCEHCYARKLVEKRRRSTPQVSFSPYVNEKQLKMKFDDRPQLIMVAAQGELFHPAIHDETIDAVLRICHDNPRKRFMILTKRSERLRDYLNDPALIGRLKGCRGGAFTLDNIAFGVSVESGRYLKRIEDLRSCRLAAHKFVAFEPLLEGYDTCSHLEGVEWVVIGAESGEEGSRRPCRLEWIESIVRGCDQRGIPVCVNTIDLGGRVTDDVELFPTGLRRDEHLFGGELAALLQRHHSWPGGVAARQVG